MYRYIALAWNSTVAPQCEAARTLISRSRALPGSWKACVDGYGLHVASSGERPTGHQTRVLSNHRGAILGSLFETPDPAQYACASTPLELTEAKVDSIVSSDGRDLVNSFWGSYVALVKDHDRERTWILPAPMSSLPCFFTIYCGVHVFFSRMEDCLSLGVVKLSYNWEYIAAHVIFDGIGASETAVEGVYELKPGERLTLHSDTTQRTLYWHPGDVARRDIIRDINEATRQVRQTAKSCIHTWAACHQTIVHKLSGGLDSSVVMGCLQDAPTNPRVICTTDYSDGANGDERYFARLSAMRAGCPLIERRRSVALRDMLHAKRTATLYGYFMELVNARPAVRTAQEVDATAIFSGTLGDVLFYRDPAIPSVTDYILTRGLRGGIFSAASSAARLERVSIWRVLRHALLEAMQSRRSSYWSFHRALRLEWPGKSVVNADLAEAFMRTDRYVHPWFSARFEIPPGKLWQIFGMSFGAFDDPFAEADDPDIVHPLMSQPLAELCLRIPTYVHLNDGWERAVARIAFVGDVPTQILGRTSKGGLEEFVKQSIRSDLKFVRECLLDGWLIREKLLDRTKLEEALSCSPTTTSIRPAEILDYLSTEIWLMKWRDVQCRNAA